MDRKEGATPYDKERRYMSKFLIFIPLPKDQAQLAEQLIRSATVFLEAQGKVERVSLGDGWERPAGRKDAAPETLKLAELRTAGPQKDEAARARACRALEGILRSTLAAAGVTGADVRVFVSEA
jgi:hypothetical protein